MRLDANLVRYMTSIEWRVLTAVEMGMKNHEFVPAPLIAKIANLRRHGISDQLSTLLKNKLVAHDGQAYDGYKLTYLGYDFLALRAFSARNKLAGVGMRIGVGKESDIHISQDCDGNVLVMKLHRLGRISFRSIKRNRDYLGKRNHASWMYMARLAAAKEYAYLKALYAQGFPVPEPIDINRHAILMQYVEGYPLSQVRQLKHPKKVMGSLMQLIVRLAEAGVVHGDFNEFNLMINDDEIITLIDFPQTLSTKHPNAEFYFARDVACVVNVFKSKFGIEIDEYPRFTDIDLPEREFNVGSTKDGEAILQELLEQKRLNTDPSNLANSCSDSEDDDDDDDDNDNDDDTDADDRSEEVPPTSTTYSSSIKQTDTIALLVSS